MVGAFTGAAAEAVGGGRVADVFDGVFSGGGGGGGGGGGVIGGGWEIWGFFGKRVLGLAASFALVVSHGDGLGRI